MSQRRLDENYRLLLHLKLHTDPIIHISHYQVREGAGVTYPAQCPKCGYAFEPLLARLPLIFHSNLGVGYHIIEKAKQP